MTLLIFYLLGCLSLVLFSLSSLCICDGFSFSLPLSLSLSPATRLRLRTRTASESSSLNNNNNNKSKSKSKSKSTIQYAMHNTNKLSLLFSSSSSSATSDTSGSSSSTTNTGDEDGGSNSSSSDHEKKDDTNNNNNNNNNNNDYSLNQNELDIQYSKFPRTWVPIASVYELDPNRPTPQIFLNQKYVCYLDQPSGQWIIMDDICPHRLAPLSEGRINRIIASTSTSTSTSESESETETETDTDNETDKKGKNNKNKDQEISSTTLQCSYHGWEYDGLNNGKCIKIPQAHNSEIEKIAIASLSKSCVKSYSVIIHKNILWFWPWKLDSLSIIGQNKKYPNGIMESISNSNIGAVNNNNNGAIVNPATYTRDLPYGWDTLVENLIDPAHIPFAHHNLQGKRDDAIPIYMSIPESFPNTITIGGTVGDNSDNNDNDNDNDNDNTTVGDNDNTTKNENDGGETGFYFEWSDRTRGKHRGGTGEFNAPYGVSYNAHYYDTEDEMLEKRGTHLIKLKNKLATNNNNNNNGEVVEADEADKEKDDTGFKLGVLCIPTKPGWSRAIVMAGPSKEKGDDKEVVVVKKEETKEKETKKKKKKSLIGMIFSIIPVWVTHLLSNKFLDSDLAFLHYQEQERLRHIQDGKYDGGSNGYYMPAQSDRCISALRKWIPKYTNYLGDENNKYELPNTIPRKELFDRYVQHTSHCRHCQKGLKQLQTKIKPRLYGLMTISILAGGFNLFRGYKLITKLIALISFGLIRFITTQIEPAFKEGEFKHYENH